MRVIDVVMTASLFSAVPGVTFGQEPPEALPVPQAQAPLPPATKLEAFRPSAGTVSILGYDELGRIVPGFTTAGAVVVEVRQLQSGGDTVQGMTVAIYESQFRNELAFVDPEELGDLLRGVDALLELKANPTTFKNFEVRYKTKGDLMVTAFSNAKGEVRFVVQTGRVLTAKRSLNLSELQRLRAMFLGAANRLTAKG